MSPDDGPIDAETVVGSLMEPVFALDGDGQVVFANERFLAISQRSREAVIGSDYGLFADIVEDGFGEFRRVFDAVAGGEADDERVELTMCHPGAAPVERRLPAEVRLSSIGGDGSRAAVLVVLRNISERVERQQELERQNRRLDEFTSVISHDLRNPLHVARGHLELAAEECDSSHLEPVADALDRIETISDHTLELARQGRAVGDTERVEVGDLVDRCWDVVDTTGCRLRVEDRVRVLADPKRLRNLFENLFRNAVEHGSTSPHSQAGGDGTDAAVTVWVGGLEDGFYVEDDGPGIPPEERETVFETGYSTEADGSGFGLAIAEQIVEGHGWAVSVTEGRAGGARFEITDVERVDR
jgi:PAS domain S-box-containing protein